MLWIEALCMLGKKLLAQIGVLILLFIHAKQCIAIINLLVILISIGN